MSKKLSTYPSQQIGMGIVKLDFSFEGNGASDPDPDTIHGDMGQVALIERTGAGTLDITLKDSFFRLLGLSGQPQSVAGEATGALYATATTNEGTSTPLVIEVSNAGSVNFVAGEKYFVSATLQTFTAGTR